MFHYVKAVYILKVPITRKLVIAVFIMFWVFDVTILFSFIQMVRAPISLVVRVSVSVDIVLKSWVLPVIFHKKF